MILLDTHVLLWLDDGRPMRASVLGAIERARSESDLLVSVISAWEIGTLVRKGRLRLNPDPLSWMRRFLEQPGINLVGLTLDAAAQAAALPGTLHGDPADRMLIATARDLGARLATRDERILAYAAETRTIEVLAC